MVASSTQISPTSPMPPADCPSPEEIGSVLTTANKVNQVVGALIFAAGLTTTSVAIIGLVQCLTGAAMAATPSGVALLFMLGDYLITSGFSKMQGSLGEHPLFQFKLSFLNFSIDGIPFVRLFK